MKIWSVLGVILLVACADAGRSPTGSVGGRDAASCKDDDGDGFGPNCDLGSDCNDNNPDIHVGCLGCVRPTEGCACDETNLPVSCYLDPSADEHGKQMCHEGTRYCREGVWSACESIFSYPKPSVTESQAILNPDAGLSTCSDCRPNCYIVRDNLNPTDGGLGGNGSNTQVADGGGLSLGTYVTDAGVVDSGPTTDAATCVIGAAPDKDCDGILDQFDPYPLDKPFATANPTIFLDLAPGATGTGAIDLSFNLNSVDVYFMVDQTTTMDGERDNLVASLTTGDYVNDANFDCADYDFDHQPNNELKNLGIIGAIRCYIRDANFGVGFFRELPFSGYADNTEIAYRNLQDITSDVTKVATAVDKLTPRANDDFDEDTTPALYSMVTGKGMYFGTDRTSVPERSGCQPNTWGYPCFRKDAIPIVLLFTDAATHNGPPTVLRAYDASQLKIATANTAQKVSMASGNDTYDTAADVGNVTNSIVSFAGDTSMMATNAAASAFSCSTTASPDAFYKFSLSSTKNVTITTEGSEFDTVLGLWSLLPTAPSAPNGFMNNNDAAGSAYGFGDVTSKFLQVSGNNSGLTSNYLAADLGCSSYASSPDTAFTFTLPQATRVALDTAGSTIGTSLSLFSGTPTLPTYTNVASTNDTIASAFDTGAINGALKAYSSTTNAGGITANYTGLQLGCGPADNAPDAVYQFSVTGGATRRVRISAEDSALDTVLALASTTGANLPSGAGYYTNNDSASSNPANLGTLDDKSIRVTGTSNSLANNYNDIGCSSSSGSRDAVFRFDLAATTTVQVDTNSSGTAFDTVLALYRNNIAATAVTNVAGSTSYDNATSGYSLGSVNGRKYVVSGSTALSMAADYSSSQTGSCNAASASPDAVYKLSVDTATRVRIDTAGSAFDTAVSLHSALPDQAATTAITTGDTLATVVAAGTVTNKNILLDATTAPATGTASFAADFALNNGGSCAAHDLAADAVVSFTVTTPGQYQIDTIGSAFDTVLGIYDGLPPTHPTTSAQGTNGNNAATAIDVGTLDNAWKSYSGNYGTLADDSNFPGSPSPFPCGANNSGRDAFYKFRLNSTRTIRIDTVGSAYDGVIGLFTNNAGALGTAVTCNDNAIAVGADMIERSLGAGDYFLVLKGKASGAGGAYEISFKDTSVLPATTPSYCDDNSGGSNTSRITAMLDARTYYAVVKGKTIANRGDYYLAIKHLGWMNAFTPLACNDNDPAGGTSSKLEYDLPAGDYFIVLKGKSAGAGGYGNYVLTVQDATTPPNGFLTCNNDTVGTTSSITETLPAGTYWVVLKGRSGAATTRGEYVLNVRDTSVTAASVLACDYNTGPSGTSAIETDLAPGSYRVIVKGRASAEKNAYKLQLRDVTSLPLGSGRTTCNYNSGSGGKSYIEQDLAAGTYTVLLKGDSATNGDYKLSIRDASRLSTESSLACDDNAGSGSLSSLTRSLTAGTYYVGVRGRTASATGDFQVHIGAGTAATDQYYTAPNWAETISELNKKSVHVIPILSCKTDTSKYGAYVRADCPNARAQFEALATATNALNSKGAPLVYDIGGDGSGLSKTVVTGVQSLAKYLEMDVGVRVVFEPDANPGFGLSIKAVDKSGDGCAAPINEEHQNCMPGATPRFEIAFTNPINAPVPLNSLAKDPKGGYNFRAELIANGSFIVDQVPIYIIPQAVVNVPPPPQVHASGTYWQTLSGNGCAGKTDLPDWSDLTWAATIPNGTTVTFGACTGASASAAASCTPTPVCTISGGAACSASTPCPTGSYCSTAGNCHRITGGNCTTHDDCRGGAMCQSNVCVYSGQPVDVGAVLGSQNLQPNLRVQIGLTANTQANIGPVVHDWSINYLCKSSL